MYRCKSVKECPGHNHRCVRPEDHKGLHSDGSGFTWSTE
jgi:hypothetical protein